MTPKLPTKEEVMEALLHSRRGYADTAVNVTKACIICEHERYADAIFEAASQYQGLEVRDVLELAFGYMPKGAEIYDTAIKHDVVIVENMLAKLSNGEKK
jgi:hypothetical protein